jgi:hypothetical protein
LGSRGRIATGKFEGDDAHFFVDKAVGGENDGAAEMIGLIVKIRDFSAGLFDEKNACGSVPALEAKFPEAIEAAGGDAGEIERSRTVTANSMRAQSEVVVVVNIRAGLAFMNGKARAKEAGGKSRNF